MRNTGRPAKGGIAVPIFARTIGIDYSGAETPTANPHGIAVYMADGDRLPAEVPPPSSPRK